MDQRTPKAEKRKTRREWNREQTEQDILVAAREEFVEYGLEAARMDRIAERAQANKRLIYLYVGNKEELYRAVLLQAYRDIRTGEQALDLTRLPPREAMSKLVGFTFDHFRANPWFIRLLSTENIHRARHVSQMPEIRELHSPIIEQMRRVLATGVAEGVFRTGVDPVQLYITIAGVTYFYFSNFHTLAVVFDSQLATEQGLHARRAHAIDVVLSYLCSKPLPESNS